MHGATATELDRQFHLGYRGRCEIALLREYRTRLIADVVTGKLDVREAAAQLPDEADETEPIDDVERTMDNETDDLVEEVTDAE
jgi:type I restriction enzyme, S subunit